MSWTLFDLEERIARKLALDASAGVANETVESVDHVLSLDHLKVALRSIYKPSLHGMMAGINAVKRGGGATAMSMSTRCYCCGQSLTLLEMHALDQGDDTASCEACEYARITDNLQMQCDDNEISQSAFWA